MTEVCAVGHSAWEKIEFGTVPPTIRMEESMMPHRMTTFYGFMSGNLADFNRDCFPRRPHGQMKKYSSPNRLAERLSHPKRCKGRKERTNQSITVDCPHVTGKRVGYVDAAQTIHRGLGEEFLRCGKGQISNRKGSVVAAVPRRAAARSIPAIRSAPRREETGQSDS